MIEIDNFQKAKGNNAVMHKESVVVYDYKM